MDELDALKTAQLFIAKEIKRVCEKCNIQYFLDSGSMLGAVRHQGFIPWDDDMDIGMLDKDYQRFLQIAPQEISDDFFIDNFQNNSDNGLVFSKVRLRGTKYIESKGNPLAKHNEIFVDIFPYYYISDNELIRKTEGLLMAIISQAIMSKSGYKVWKGDSKLKRVKFIPSDIIGHIFSKKTMHSWIDWLYGKHLNTSRVCVHAGSCYDYWFFPVEIFEKYIDVSFENIDFPIPENYDLYLKVAYGDYMKLPPVEQRITHQIQKLDLGKYSDYFEKIDI